jgi:hypothetical protein
MTTWYARRASQNIDANDGSTWNDKADGSGNWLTWANLGATDVLEANGNAGLVINVDVTCGKFQTLSGGGFTITAAAAAHTITAASLAGTSTCITATLSATYALLWDGDITGGSSTNARGLSTASSGILNIGLTQRTLTGGSASGTYAVLDAYGFRNSTWNAHCVGTTVAAVSGFTSSAGNVVTINGNITSSATAQAVLAFGSGKWAVNGNWIQAAGGPMPFVVSTIGGTFAWNTAASGTISFYDTNDVQHVLKVPDYPAEAKVESGVKFDYNTKTGTLAAGYTYGDESQDKVLTTATGAGTYQAVDAADVRDGTAVGVSPAVGTLDLPAVNDVLKDVKFDGETKTGLYVVPAEADVKKDVNYGIET